MNTFKPCGRPGCSVCFRMMVVPSEPARWRRLEEPRESFAMALLGAAAVVVFAVALFAILWALA